MKSIKHIAGRAIDRFLMPVIPHKYRLKVKFHRFTKLSGFEPEVLQLKAFAKSGPIALDVGANMGIYTFAMSNSGMFDKIIAFEPNPALVQDLESAKLPNVTLVKKAVSNETGESVLRIPKRGSHSLAGWASLEQHLDLDADAFDEFTVETISLDGMNLEGVSFVKIDVEGHELKLLEGAKDFFSTNCPTCMIEVRDRNMREIEDYFTGLDVGYAKVDTENEFGFRLSPGNVLFRVQ